MVRVIHVALVEPQHERAQDCKEGEVLHPRHPTPPPHAYSRTELGGIELLFEAAVNSVFRQCLPLELGTLLSP